ncbi:hypothetical protein DPMN_043856 [Dreissena polymorpha]|uniref:Uncharacterized protein n=2 Tax=Dreissena polymorpha TaxID=45954 RepID=A0A9D4HYB5_DREPO|nr:hypothetical protein DPMN_043856 [Dreissena polymorpha]
MKGVVRCSKNIGHLEVIIENTHDSEATMNGVTLYLQHKNIQPLFIRGTIAPLISSGDRVSNERLLKQIPEKFATLGGFALQFPKTTSNPNFNTAATSLPSSPASQHTRGKLVALISRHVATAIGCECVNAYNDTETFELGKINNIHDNPLVDIIPFDIKEDCINKCDRRFKTEIGIQMYGQVSPEERIREGDQVYIWGAATSLGLGTIDSVNLETPNGLLITIHDRNEGESFCKEGDSGAMVCATDRRERTLYAIAMIQGKLHRSSGRAIYVAVSLNEGFKILETHYLSKFSLCNDQPHA